MYSVHKPHYFFLSILLLFLSVCIFSSCGENGSGSGGVKSSKDYEAIADQARRAISEHQYSTAVSMLQDGAQNGHVRSQRYLGVCLLMLDREVEGASWIRRAAEAGDEVSQFNIAKCYNYGIGVKASIEEVRFWTQKLEDSGWEGVSLAMTFGGRNFKLEEQKTPPSSQYITVPFRFATLSSMGAFFDATTERIFEESGKGILASL